MLRRWQPADQTWTNLVNARIRKICVLTQYKSHSLDRHITTTCQLNSLLGNYVAPVPAQQRLGPHWQGAQYHFQRQNDETGGASMTGPEHY